MPGKIRIKRPTTTYSITRDVDSSDCGGSNNSFPQFCRYRTPSLGDFITPVSAALPPTIFQKRAFLQLGFRLTAEPRRVEAGRRRGRITEPRQLPSAPSSSSPFASEAVAPEDKGTERQARVGLCWGGGGGGGAVLSFPLNP